MTMRRFLAIVAALSFVAPSAMVATGAERVVTVGQFASRVVAAVGQDASDIEAVKRSLRTMGVVADFDATAPLTAGMAARIAGDLGVQVRPSSTPASPLSTGQAVALAGHIAGVVVDQAAASLADTPDQCLSSDNRGACVACCKEATGLTGKFCGRFCQANVPPPPSPEEPLP